MLDNTTPPFGGVSRRSVLKAGAVSAAAFTLGTGTVGADHGATGGSLLTVGEPRVGEPFTAVPLMFEFPIPASCQASESELKDYDILSVTYPNLSLGQLGAVLRDDTHFDSSGRTTYEFTSVQGCKEPDVPGVHRASFRPLHSSV